MEALELRSSARQVPAVAEISREIVRVYATQYGRGPTKAKTTWREGMVVCILEDIFSRMEGVLVESGRFEQVRSHRQVFNDAVEPALRQVVERATGERVRSFLAQVNEDGVMAEIFLLDP